MSSRAVLRWAPPSPWCLAPALLVAACGVRVIPHPGATLPDGGAVARPDSSVRDGGGAAPGQVAIGGVVLPRDRVVVFLHVGHSNMAGRATTPPELQSFNYDTHPRLWAYAGGGAWRPAREPLSPDSMTGMKAGPGMSILRAALALARPDQYVVSIGHGHSGQTGGYCSNFRRGGLLYQVAMGPAMELRGKVTFGAIFTMFGTSEVNEPENIPRFGECMQAVAADMRADLGEPELPFMIGDWEANSMTSLTPTSSSGRAIIPQLRALPMTIRRSAVIPTEGLPIIRNDHHYDFTGHKLWAERGFAIMQQQGWNVWAAPR